jgi:hypothetical protein
MLFQKVSSEIPAIVAVIVTDPSVWHHHDGNHSSLPIASRKATETQDTDCV